MGSDDGRAESDAKSAIALVEAAIRGLGIDPESARGPGDGRSTQFALRRGSARIAVVIHASEGAREGSLRVAAPVVKLPALGQREPLYARLLELNAAELVGAAFGVLGDDVVVVTERPLRDLDASEVDAAIRGVGRIADKWDDALATGFGVQRSSG